MRAVFGSPQRLRALVYYGGGPQVVTLTLVPLAIIAIHASLGSRRLWVHVLAGAAAASVALTDAFGAAFLCLAVVCLFFTTEGRSPGGKLRLLLTIGSAAYLAVCPWLRPSLLRIAARNSEIAGGDYHWSPRSFVALAIVILSFAAAWLASRRWKAPHRFVLLLAALLTSIPVLASFGLNAMPQAMRYHVEMEIPLCLLLAFGAHRLWRILPRGAGLAIITFGLMLAMWQAGHYWRFARQLILPPADVYNSVEYRITSQMVTEFGRERVMIAGSPALFANVFANVRQLAGAHDQFNANPSLLAAGLVQYGGRDAARLGGSQYVIWLQAFGAHGINVPGETSEEPYKPFHENPNLFEGLLPVIWRDRGDTIYRVPQRSEGLAHVVPPAAIVRVAPKSPYDSDAAARYVAALNDPSLPLASWQESEAGSAIIRGEVQPGQVVSVQTTYNQGWRATVNGMRQRTFADGLGMLVIEPACRGDCEIHLRFDGGIEAKVTMWISILTLAAIGGCLWRWRRV